MKFEHFVYIEKSPQDVYSAYESVSSWAIWDPGTVAASLNGEFVIGSTGKIKTKGAPESKIKLTEVTRNKSFTVECGLPLCKMHFVHILDEINESTKVTNQLFFTGLFAPIFSRLFGSSIDKTIPDSLAGLKTHLESQS